MSKKPRKNDIRGNLREKRIKGGNRVGGRRGRLGVGGWEAHPRLR
jgi:hypothetical protein